MDGRQELAERLNDWLRARNWSPRRLSLAAGLAENAVGRILERPERETSRETWRKLAEYLKWSWRETEGLAYGVAPTSEELEPWEAFQRALARLPLSERHRAHLEFQAEVLLRDSEGLRQGSPPVPTGVPQ